MFVPRFDEQQLRAAIQDSNSWAEVLRKLGYRSAGGNWRTVQKYAAAWSLDTDHFDPWRASSAALIRSRGRSIPLTEVMVKSSTYKRVHLKRRLFEEGIKQRCCEMCGQGEIWRGARMALILDHINGVPDDHRLENLRILCPNCAGTLSTHCGRKNELPVHPRTCPTCGREFVPRTSRTRYCSQPCGIRWDRSHLRGVAQPSRRRVDRAPRDELLAEIAATSYVAVGRKYGVSDNAVRKWVRFYEREAESDRASGPGEGRDEAA